MKRNLILITICAFLVASAWGEEKNIGLCLSGGGAKGAYEVGVWKALDELGLTKRIKAISGTSVGGLNAALFSCVSAKQAERLWKTDIGAQVVLAPDIENISASKETLLDFGRNIMNSYEKNKQIANSNHPLLVTAKSEGLTLSKAVAKYFSDFALSDKHIEGIFTREPLKKVISDNVSIDKIEKSGLDIYATVVRKRRLAAKAATKFFNDDYSHTFLLNEQFANEDVYSILLATSAIPIAFASVSLSEDVIEKGKPVGKVYEYVDGGFEAVGGKNTPVKPLAVDDDIETVIVVYLASEKEMTKGNENSEAPKKSKRITLSEVDNKELIEIIPSKSLGNMIEGTLNFDDEKINDLITLGYSDTMKVMKRLEQDYY